MNVTAQKFQSSYALVCKSSARRNHRTTLPQSALAGCQLPQRGSRETPPQCQSPARWMFCQRAGDFWGFCVGAGTFYHSTGYLRNRGVTGDFHRPYETQKFLVFTIHRTTLPQSASLTAPSGREPGGAVPFIVPLGNRNISGDFHRPYETLKFLSVYVHRSTLPQSRIRSTAPSEREPGGAYHSTGYSLKSGVTGDFHRPYESSEIFTFYHQGG